MSASSLKGPVFDPGLCRCCGTMRKCRLLSAEYSGVNGVKEVYSDMIMDCFGLLLSYLDNKPTDCLICAVCVHRLRDADAFRKQVLQCEEAFLQLRMCDTKFEASSSEKSESRTVPMGDSTMVEIEVVKEEPHSAPSSPASPSGDAPDEPIYDSLATPEAASATGPHSPPPRLRPRPAPRPLAERARRQTKTRIVGANSIAKKKLPMSKMQQIIRERDTSYMVLTNVLTVIEFSYACPFKCRHNNLICYYCGAHFADPQVMREHTQDHHPKRFKISEKKNVIKLDLTRIDCRLCPIKINSLDEFKKHVSTVHGKPFYFDQKDSILPFRLKKDEFKCALCGLEYPFFHALNKHMNEHFSNFVCETCGLGFVDSGRFMMHQQRHEEADYPCPECGKNFKAQYNRDLHIDRVHKKKGRVYCPKCDVMLMSYHQKLKHLVEVHGDTPMSFPCSMCDKVLDSRRNLTIHKRKDHLKDYRYECQCCGQKFFTNFALRNHMPTHTGERNYQCKVCHKSYPRLKTLTEHTRIHNNDRRYRCHVCGQAFIQNCSLKGHMKSQHPDYG